MQKGFSPILWLILLAIIISIAVFASPIIKQKNSQVPNISIPSPVKSLKKEPNIYSNKDLGVEFSYEGDSLVAKEDTEEVFNKRGKGDFRKNFKGYVGYEPGKFLGAVVVLEEEGNYEINPFSVWLFDNPDELSIDKWHHDYWYYPFVWGDFTSEGKFIRAPQEEATVSGQTGKSGIIEYQPGKPKFIYISKEGKMYLFRIIGEDGDKILATFKFLP